MDTMKISPLRQLLVGLGFVVLTGIAFLAIERAAQGQVPPPTPLLGWAWGGSEQTHTWTGPPPDNQRVTVNSPVGLGWISMSSNNFSPPGNVAYNVLLPFTDGPLGGSAWSENLGFIDFTPAGPYPTSPSFSVQRQANKLIGWARIRTIAQGAPGNTGGLEGWIKFWEGGMYAHADGDGVEIIPDFPGATSGDLKGYAWSDEFGWIDMNGVCFGRPACTAPVPPSVDIFVLEGGTRHRGTYNVPGPVTGQGLTIGWESQDANDCVITRMPLPSPQNWNGRSGSQTTGRLDGPFPYVYTAECTGRGGIARNSVTIDISRVLPVSGCAPHRNPVFRRQGTAARVDWTVTHEVANPPQYDYAWSFTPAPGTPPPPYTTTTNQIRTTYPYSDGDGIKQTDVRVTEQRTGREGTAHCEVEVRTISIIEG